VVRRIPAAGALRVERESRADQHLPNFVALAGDGSAMLIAWFADGGIYAARVAADGAVLDATPLRVAPAALARNARRIVIAPGADGAFLIVWGGTIPGCLCSPTIPPEAGPVRAARVTATLSLLDAVPIQVANVGGGTLNADAPAAAWNGQEWLVVWNRAFGDLMGPQPVIGQEIRGRRIARNGTLLDSTADQPGILIVRDGFAPAIAWNGAAYVFAWREGAPHYDGLFSSQRIQPMHVASLDLAGVTSAVTLGESADEEPISISVTDGFAFLGYARIGDSARYGGVSRAFLTVPDSDRRRRRAAQPLR
jgi:hypothetical protein